MNQKDKFSNILSQCMDRILKGETVEQCLDSYPEQAKELEPLLRVASVARVASTVQPRVEFRAKARYELSAAMHEIIGKKSQRRPLFPLRWQWHSGWAMAVIAVIVMLLGGGSTIVAASNSMPDSTLYPVKLATEEIQLALTSSDLDKTELNATFAYRRADEIVYLAAKGDLDQVNVTAERFNSNLENMTNLTGNDVRNTAAIPNQSTLSADRPTVVAPGGITPTISPEILTSMTASVNTDEPKAASESKPSEAGDGSALTTEEASKLSAEIQDERSSEHTSTKALSPKLERLKKIISDNFEKRQHRLEEAFKTAPPNVKTALRLTIIKSRTEYDKAIRNLHNPQKERDMQ